MSHGYVYLLRLSITPPKTTIVSSPSLFVTVTNEVRDWPVPSDTKIILCNFCKTVHSSLMEPSFVSEFQNETVRFFISQPIPVYNPFYPSKAKRGKINLTFVSNQCYNL